ncbi:MAG: PIN domain-containing protein [Planctomycetes bacterium]|nr:PIN domain-containing protein [Planctomycetota bacterium]
MSNNAKVLIDTSVWIEYFNKPKSAHGNNVKNLIEADSAFISGIIMAELLQGAGNTMTYEELRNAMLFMPYLAENQATWEKTGRLSFELKRKGKTIPLSDCIIAVLSKENGCLLYTLDSHFNIIPEVKFYTA